MMRVMHFLLVFVLAMSNVSSMRECASRPRCGPLPLGRAVLALLLAGTLAVAQEAAHGTLVLQSPVQAVATINGEGVFLLIPGQDLRWSRIRPGNYRIGISSGGQQWQREVQVQPGRTETLVAALSSAGSPLAAGLPPPVAGATSAYVAPVPVPPPAATLSNPTENVTQQRKEDREEQEAQRRREEDLLRQQRETQRRAQEMQEEQEKNRKPKRPKVH